jgi:hypothetical protein
MVKRKRVFVFFIDEKYEDLGFVVYGLSPPG